MGSYCEYNLYFLINMTKIKIFMGFLSLSNLKMKVVLTVLVLLLCEQASLFDSFFDDSSMIINGCVLLVIVGGTYFD